MDIRTSKKEMNKMSKPEIFLGVIKTKRIDVIDEYLKKVDDYLQIASDEERKSETITVKNIFLWLKDLYELHGATINSIIDLKEWVTALHRETLGNQNIDVTKEGQEHVESLRERFENTFGEVEKIIKTIKEREETTKKGVPYA